MAIICFSMVQNTHSPENDSDQDADADAISENDSDQSERIF